MPDKDPIVTLSLFASIILGLTTLWWRVSSKFVPRAEYDIQLAATNKTLAKFEKGSDAKWKELRDMGKAIVRIDTTVSEMAKNKRKRKGDNDD